MKVKLNEVAELAGVGLATVDRVLNERGGVTRQTERKVIEAARQLGWARNIPVPYRTGVRFEVLLAHRETRMYAGLNAAFERLMANVARGVIIQRSVVDHRRPAAFAKAMLESRSNALIIHGQQEDVIVDAISACQAAGVPVVTLISDLPTSERYAYAGIDHRKAGRTAAFLLSKMSSSATFIVLCHSSVYWAHSERIGGFKQAISEYRPEAGEVRVVDRCDDDATTWFGLSQVLHQCPGPVAIYNAGAANSVIEHSLRRLRATGVTFVGHDFAGDSYSMLRDGTMAASIAERLDLQVERAVDILLHKFGFVDHVHTNGMTPFSVLLRDTID